jgi:hypothetical protein
MLGGGFPFFVKLIRRFLSKTQKRRINLTKKVNILYIVLGAHMSS